MEAPSMSAFMRLLHEQLQGDVPTGEDLRDLRIRVLSRLWYLPDFVEVNKRGRFSIAEDETAYYDAAPMLVNHRLIVTPTEAHRTEPDYAWCYRDFGSLLLGWAIWCPETEDEPTGWHKRPGFLVRRAPRRDARPEYNLVRCCHGDYPHKGPCSKDKYCRG